jgi:hypothetical protein
MRMTVDDPRAMPSLLAALREGDCVAALAGPASVVVQLPWLVSAEDARQARVELGFFARAWEAANAGVTLTVFF